MNEEDIKNLSEIIELCEAEINNNDENVTAILDLTDLKSLRNLINRNKELEEILKDNWEFRDKCYIPKSKIKENMEELKQEYKIELEKNSIKAFILKCKIEALEELLQKG